MITTISNDISITDFDLYNRIVEGFDSEIIKLEDIGSIKGKIIYCHGENFVESLSTGIPVVCLGSKWHGENWIGQNIANGVNGYISNNIEELRYIIRQLLDLPIDKLAPLGYNGKILADKIMEKYQWELMAEKMQL